MLRLCYLLLFVCASGVAGYSQVAGLLRLFPPPPNARSGQALRRGRREQAPEGHWKKFVTACPEREPKGLMPASA
jgi:hypothetical protein